MSVQTKKHKTRSRRGPRPDKRVTIVMGPDLGKYGRLLRYENGQAVVRMKDSGEVREFDPLHVEFRRGSK